MNKRILGYSQFDKKFQGLQSLRRDIHNDSSERVDCANTSMNETQILNQSVDNSILKGDQSLCIDENQMNTMQFNDPQFTPFATQFETNTCTRHPDQLIATSLPPLKAAHVAPPYPVSLAPQYPGPVAPLYPGPRALGAYWAYKFAVVCPRKPKADIMEAEGRHHRGQRQTEWQSWG